MNNQVLIVNGASVSGDNRGSNKRSRSSSSSYTRSSSASTSSSNNKRKQSRRNQRKKNKREKHFEKMAKLIKENEGRTKWLVLTDITYRILKILDQNQIHFKVHHVPGMYNNHVDHLSRYRRPPEWYLLPTSVEMVFRKWGKAVVDLFASATAHVVHNYVSLDLTDRQALIHDAVSVQWNFQIAWVFPLPFLVPKLLSHLKQTTGVFLVVVPRWEGVNGKDKLKARALTASITLRNLHKNLIDTATGLLPPKKPSSSRCGNMKVV